MERRLAAILLTDMVGYSRLIGLDEEGTIARQKAHREEVIDPKISGLGGRIVKTTGDGLLVEFPSVVDAVRCAIDVQRELVGRDTDVPKDRHIQYRIGINLGDIVVDGDDILGDGVNVAARLEGLAEPGGICISGAVYDHLAGKLDVVFEDAGEQTVKNVSRPVRVWRWRMKPPNPTLSGESHLPPVEAAAQALSVAAPNERWTTPESVERNSFIAPRVRDGSPVIAIVPFKNLSSGFDFSYLSEGLADDILFSLSGFRWFKVLGRSSTFHLADQLFNLKELYETFGATHLVSGQIRPSGRRLRISVELTDCRSQRQIWSARYDENVDRLFELEDQIVAQIASSIVPALEEAEMQALLNKAPSSLSAYELLQRGNWHLFSNLSSYDSDDEAARCFESALKIDPNYAAALAALAYVKYRGSYKYIATNFHEHLEDARQTALQALAIDPREPRALRYLAAALSMLRDQDGAWQALQHSIELCPSYATAYSGLAFVHDFRGDFEDAKIAADQTMLLRPHDPILHRCVISKSIAHYQTGDYETAERIAQNSVRTNAVWWMSNAMLASSLAQQGKIAASQLVVERIHLNHPGLKMEKLLDGMPFTNPDHVEHLKQGLVKAGWEDSSAAAGS